MKQPPKLENSIDAIQRVARDLRDPDGGCLWALKQDHSSLKRYLIEESYEVIDAIDTYEKTKDDTELKEELGDLFFQVVFHSQLADERGSFNLEDVAQGIAEKLIFRHPHVYGDLEVKDANQVLQNWEKLKKKERENKNKKKPDGALSGVPKYLPALQKAFHMGQKVEKLGFDWSSDETGTEQVFAKIQEEIDELKKELPDQASKFKTENQNEQKERATLELGDLFFALAQLARRFHIDPEEALQKSNAKFQSRFEFMESQLREVLKGDENPTLDQWEQQWQKAKQAEKSTQS